MEILEILAAVTWEHLAFVFALVFIFLFRGHLSGLIKRTTKISKDGLAAEASPEMQREQNRTTPEAVQQLLDVVGSSLVIAENEEAIRRDLTSRGLPAEGDSIKVLVKHLAGAQTLLAFERAYNSIFGSQIYLLKRLNEMAGQGRSLQFILAHIEHVKTMFPEALGQWTPEQYLEFLHSHLLIVRHNDQFHISNFGVEFLTWMVRNGRLEGKAL